MPGYALHLEIADRVLHFWEVNGTSFPVSPTDPAQRNAFLLGSLGPDLGYLPGGDSLLADLAHCVRPADLARNLIASATSEAELAFAWGWATHVLGDIWIHPLINEAVGEFVHAGHNLKIAYADDPISHIRVETGLDAILPAYGNWTYPPRIWRSTGVMASTLIVSAYRRTFGYCPSLVRLKTVLRFAGIFTTLTLLNGAVASGRPSGLLARSAYRGIARIARRFDPGGILAAFTNPLLPTSHLTQTVKGVVERFPELFRPYYESSLSHLPNLNLDTGLLEGDPPSYSLTLATAHKLDRIRQKHGTHGCRN